MGENTQNKDRWQKGLGLDLWTIPHILYGILMGLVPSLTGTSFLIGLGITIVLALAWEVYEQFAGINETVLNIFVDVLVSIAAYALVALALMAYPLHFEDVSVIAVAVFIIYVFTNISGWRAYRNRHRDFMN